MNLPTDYLYEVCHPDYFEVQTRDLFWYERLWMVLLRQLEGQHPQRTLIEWGSGPGNLLEMASKRGWWGVGIEPSEVARKQAKSIGVDSSPLYNGHSLFRHSIATEVLEHVEDPLHELIKWRGALLQGGYLALSVPNDNNPLQRLFGRWISKNRKTPKFWIDPTHRSYFNMKSLCALLEEAGFRVVWRRTSFPVEILLAIPFLKRNWAWKLSRVWPAPPLLWRFGIGRHLLVVAKKV